MNILHINTHFNYGGGAAKSAYELHQNLIKRGINSRFLSGYSGKYGGKPENGDYLYNYKFKWINALINRVTGLDSFYYPFFNKTKFDNYVRDSDIIHFHNIHGYYFNIKLLKLLEDKTVVITVRDYWNITGNCAYFLECDNWKSGCGNCPDIFRYPKSWIFDNSHYLLSRKKHFIENLSNLHIICPSDTVKKIIEHSYLKEKYIATIYNGVDTNIFNYKNKIKGSSKEKVILAVADDISDPRKNFKLLIDSINTLGKDYKLQLIGNKKNSYPDNLNIELLGYIEDKNRLSKYYSDADLFINLSQDETFGRTSVESLLCGTPVLALDTPIMHEVLSDKGIFVRPTIENIRKNIEFFFNTSKTSNKQVIRNYALKFSKINYINGYIALYKSIINR